MSTITVSGLGPITVGNQKAIYSVNNAAAWTRPAE